MTITLVIPNYHRYRHMGIQTLMLKKLLFSITLADCDVHTFTVGGHGGSGKDTANTGVRIIHRASGATGIGRDERSQLANKRAAFRRMADSDVFKRWHRLEVARRSGLPSIESLVDADLDPINLRIDVRNERGQWVPESCSKN